MPDRRGIISPDEGNSTKAYWMYVKEKTKYGGIRPAQTALSAYEYRFLLLRHKPQEQIVTWL